MKSKSEKIEGWVRVISHGSMMRSATCPFESSYHKIEFNDKIYYWFTDLWIPEGMWFLRAFVRNNNNWLFAGRTIFKVSFPADIH